MKNQAMSSYMRIRHYILDWLARSQNSVTRLPSNRELAEKFGVSQTTVVRALQELIKEGVLNHRPGVGLFSNPERGRTRGNKIWGMVLGDGRWSFLTREAMHIVNCFGRELLERERHSLFKLVAVDEAFDGSGNLPEFSMLTGICWWMPEDEMFPEIRKIAAKIPMVVLGKQIDGVHCFRRDFEEENYRIARCLIGKGCRRPVLVLPELSREAAIRGVERACEESGIPLPPGCLLENDAASIRDLERMVDLHCPPDGIIFNREFDDFIPLLERRPELKNCLLYSDELWLSRDWDFHGLVGRVGYSKIASKVAALLERGIPVGKAEVKAIPTDLEFVVAPGKTQERRTYHETKTLHID